MVSNVCVFWIFEENTFHRYLLSRDKVFNLAPFLIRPSMMLSMVFLRNSLSEFWKPVISKKVGHFCFNISALLLSRYLIFVYLGKQKKTLLIHRTMTYIFPAIVTVTFIECEFLFDLSYPVFSSKNLNNHWSMFRNGDIFKSLNINV